MMMDEVVNQILMHVAQIFLLILSFVTLYLVRMLKAWLAAKLTNTEQALLADIASSAVLYVQQKYPTYADSFKLDKALLKADELLKAKGFEFDEKAMETLIESQLFILKNNMIDTWQKTS